MPQETSAAIPQDQNPAESAPAAQPEAPNTPAGEEEHAGSQTEGEGDGEQEKPKPEEPRGVKKRLDELRRQAGDAERRAERAFALLEQTLLKGQPPKVEQPSGPPRRENFETYEEYLEAKADFRISEEIKAIEQRAMQRRAVEAAQQREMTWEQRKAAAAKQFPDFEEVTGSDDLAISDTMADEIKNSEIGTQIAYFLGKNPDEAARIFQLSPRAQVREIGKIEARLEAKPPTVRQSKAPPPIDPIGGSSRGTSDAGQISQAEYEARRAKEGAWWASGRR